MNREIKFRVFFYDGIDYSTGEMVDFEYAISEDFISSDGKTLKPNDECSIIMQYTGLKDKNGKEIYEGDILGFKLKNDYSKKPMAVKFSNGNFVAYNPNCCDVCKNSFGCTSNLDECLFVSGCAEVIGNIYENPELTKK